MTTMPRILTSSKYQSAIVVTVLAAVALAFGLLRSPGLDAAERAVNTFIIAVAGAWGVAVAGTSLEDYGEKRDAPSAGQSAAAPTVQVNTGTQAANTQQPPQNGGG